MIRIIQLIYGEFPFSFNVEDVNSYKTLQLL